MKQIESRHQSRIGIAAAGVLLQFASQALAGSSPGDTTVTGSSASVPALERAYLLLGAGVYDSHNRVLGRIAQIVLNRELDSVAYVVLELDEKTKTEVPLPLAAIRRNNDGLLSTDITAANIWRAPRFDGEKLLEMGEQSFAVKVYNFYKDHSTRYLLETGAVAPTGGSGRSEGGAVVPNGSPYLAVTRLIGLGVRVDSGNLGSIRDLVFDRNEGRIVYGVISVPGIVPRKMVVVPWTALEMRLHDGVAMLYAARSTLGLLAFSNANFPNLIDQTYTSRLLQTFGREPSWQVYGYAPRKHDPNAVWRAGSDFNRNFDRTRLKLVEGSVENVLTFVPGPEAAAGLRLRIRTDQGDTVTVLAGPMAYCDMIGLMMKDGDKVTIRGSESTIDERPVVLASEVLIGGALYRIRDQDGQPLWQLTHLD